MKQFTKELLKEIIKELLKDSWINSLRDSRCKLLAIPKTIFEKLPKKSKRISWIKLRIKFSSFYLKQYSKKILRISIKTPVYKFERTQGETIRVEFLNKIPCYFKIWLKKFLKNRDWLFYCINVLTNLQEVTKKTWKRRSFWRTFEGISAKDSPKNTQ